MHRHINAGNEERFFEEESDFEENLVLVEELKAGILEGPGITRIRTQSEKGDRQIMKCH